MPGRCSLKHHCPRVQRCGRGAEEDSCCPCLFVAMVVPSLRTEGSIIWNFSVWGFFPYFLLTVCKQQGEGRSCHVLQIDCKSQTSWTLERRIASGERKGVGKGVGLNGRKEEAGAGSRQVMVTRGEQQAGAGVGA